MSATTDRGEILHLAGRLHLSPALDASGGPAFSAAPGEGLARCGWEAFFDALEARRLAVELADEAEPRLVPASAEPSHPCGLARALAHSRRFLTALRGP